MGEAVVALSGARWDSLSRALLATLDVFHGTNRICPASGMERLRLQSEPRLPAPVFRAGLQQMAQDRQIALDGAWVGRAGFTVRLTPADEANWALILPLLSDSERFRPPRVRDIAQHLGSAEADVRRLLKLLSRLAQVDEVAHDHFFLRRTVGEMVEMVARLTAAHGLHRRSVSRPGENGRKVAIQILEFLDRHGVTLRRGDLRRINPHGWTCSAQPAMMRELKCRRIRRRMEEKRPWWGVRIQNPGGAASRSLVGSTPTLFATLSARRSYPRP